MMNLQREICNDLIRQAEKFLEVRILLIFY